MKHYYLLTTFLIFAFTANAQYTKIPDANFENALAAYDDIAADGQVPTNNINTLNFLNVGNNNISSLNGIQDFTALEQLWCNSNNLTTLDLSQNTNLQRLRSYSNPLISLDLSNNSQLFELRVYACPSLTSVNISNGNNSNIVHLNISSNTNLTCVEVDNQTIADDWNNGINLPATYSTGSSVVYCVLGTNEAYVPDDAFEAYLETNSLGNGIANDNRADKSLVSSATALFLSNLGINETIGLEEFTALETLLINDNNLNVIYLENLINLTAIRVSRNNLNKLNLNNQPNLELILADVNHLSIIPTNSSVIRTFQITQNEFATVDVSNYPLLEFLYCSGNMLTTIDVSNNPELKLIECQFNDITSLDVSGNPDLTDILVFDNELESLNVKNGNNTILTSFRADNNSNLLCIDVDDETAATNGTGSYSSWQKDVGTSYSEDCAATLNTSTFERETISAYPNPVTNTLNINVINDELEKIDVIDINGRLMMSKNSNLETVNMSQLNTGIYFVTLYGTNEIKTIKILKK